MSIETVQYRLKRVNGTNKQDGTLLRDILALQPNEAEQLIEPLIAKIDRLDLDPGFVLGFYVLVRPNGADLVGEFLTHRADELEVSHIHRFCELGFAVNVRAEVEVLLSSYFSWLAEPEQTLKQAFDSTDQPVRWHEVPQLIESAGMCFGDEQARLLRAIDEVLGHLVDAYRTANADQLSALEFDKISASSVSAMLPLRQANELRKCIDAAVQEIESSPAPPTSSYSASSAAGGRKSWSEVESNYRVFANWLKYKQRQTERATIAAFRHDHCPSTKLPEVKNAKNAWEKREKRLVEKIRSQFTRFPNANPILLVQNEIEGMPKEVAEDILRRNSLDKAPMSGEMPAKKSMSDEKSQL